MLKGRKCLRTNNARAPSGKSRRGSNFTLTFLSHLRVHLTSSYQNNRFSFNNQKLFHRHKNGELVSELAVWSTLMIVGVSLSETGIVDMGEDTGGVSVADMMALEAIMMVALGVVSRMLIGAPRP